MTIIIIHNEMIAFEIIFSSVEVEVITEVAAPRAAGIVRAGAGVMA
jgi:hypothetical protein